MRIIIDHKEQRRSNKKTAFALLTATAIALISSASLTAYAQQKDIPPQIYNPKSAWAVKDQATETNPSCTMSRGYNPEISIHIRSDVSGKATLNIRNHPEGLARISQVSIDGAPLNNIETTANSLTATIGHADELSKLYDAEAIVLNEDGGRRMRFPVQSTAVAEAKMSLCVDVIDQLKKAVTTAGAADIIDTPSLAAPITVDMADAAPPALDTPLTIDDIISDVTAADDQDSADAPDDVAQLIDRISTSDSKAQDETPEIIDAPTPLTAELSDDVETITATGTADDIEDISADLSEELTSTEPETEVIDLADEVAADQREENIAGAQEEFVNLAQSMEQDALKNSTPLRLEDNIKDNNKDPLLDVEALIDESLPLAPPSVTPIDAPTEEVAEEVDVLDTASIEVANDDTDIIANLYEVQEEADNTEATVEDFGATNGATNKVSPGEQTDVMDDTAILSALENSLSVETLPPEQNNALTDDYPSDIPLDELATLASPAEVTIEGESTAIDNTEEAASDTAIAEINNTDSEQAAEDVSVETLIDQAMLEVPAQGSTEPTEEATESAEITEEASSTSNSNIDADTLFEDGLSLDIEDDSSISSKENEDIIDELADEDFSDEELLALLDDPDALAEDFTEIMIEEEFKQVKPMEGIRDMLGLGTPDDIEYKKVPWLMEEDIDEQWKLKVKLLEREKEMLRLKLADTKANPIADLISRKRNKRTQEELVEKIRALEAENEKLKKGLVLSKTPEEFLGEDLKISDPKSGMKIGGAPTSKIDLIDEEVDSELTSLETRMDSFLKGVGEDYALANPEQVSPLSASSLTQDIINILKEGYVVDPDSLKIRAYRHKASGTAVTAWEAGDLEGRAERSVLPPNSDFTAYVERFLNAAQLRCNGNFTAVPDTSTRNLKTLDIHCNDGALGQRSSVIFVRHGQIITAIATTTNLPKGDTDFLRDIRKRIIEGIRIMDKKRT